MKKIKLLSWAILIGLFVGLFAVNIVQANEACGITDICYKPNVPIKIEVGGVNFAQASKVEGGAFLSKYIVAIYQYGAGFAGIVAMFMLVIAGWRWLMAGGNAQKITSAKDIVNGVLIGLALLFGGQLLLRQISEDFASIPTLDIVSPVVSNCAETNLKPCGVFKIKATGNDVSSTRITYCTGSMCGDAGGTCVVTEKPEDDPAITIGNTCWGSISIIAADRDIGDYACECKTPIRRQHERVEWDGS
jgi:hypothetical protein